MEVTRLTKTNHYEAIIDQMKRLIAEGNLQAGDKLPSTKELSERFGVGRSTMREALSGLKAMGLIDIRQGGVSTVAARGAAAADDGLLPDAESLRSNRTMLLELLEVRQALEVSNAALAAEKRTAEDAAELAALVADMKRAIGDEAEGQRTDIAFHSLLARATHNAMIVRLFGSIMQPLETAIREIRRVELYASHAVARRLYREHEAICDAVVRQDSARAALWMKRHLQHVESILMKYV